MWLSQALVQAVDEAEVTVFYVSFAATRLWAAERDKGEPLVFSGYYWGQGPRESGPFRSMSAAYRDAYFRVVRHKAPPVIGARNQDYERKLNHDVNVARRKRAARRKQQALNDTHATT